MIFQAGNARESENVHESASLFNLKEKKNDSEESRMWTHAPYGPVYYANY